MTEASSPRKPKRRWLWRGLGLLLLLPVAAIAGLYFWQRQSLPAQTGSKALPGLERNVSLSRSPEGLVFIEAGSEGDAAFALGYAHAQDRLLQMELMRRLAAGRLSEAVGSSTVKIDRMMRTLGLYRLAEENAARISPEAQALLQRYADGVNAFLTTRDGPLPLSFLMIGEPEPWRPADSIAWGRLMALILSQNYKKELLNAQLSQVLPEAKRRQLFPAYPDWAPAGASALRELQRQGHLNALYRVLPWEIGPKTASNAWAVAPRHSTTGGALLAGDPHLALRAPGHWYLARIETPGLTLSGATAPGTPFLLFGHNGRLAWTFTTTYGDTQDLFIEEIDPDNPGYYKTEEGWRPFETREETLRIAGAEPLTFTVRKTRHGPVLSDVVEEARDLYPGHRVLALAWSALQGDDRSAEGIYRLNRAPDVAAAIAALRDLDSPQQTVILADSRGSIALIAPGRVPIRRAGDGLLPVPGAGGAYDWIGEVPYEALPRVVDPESGILLTANNRLVGDDYPYLIAAEWAHPGRAARIADLLAEKQRFSPEDMRKMQLDDLSYGARRLMQRLLQAELPAGAALARLRKWDFRMDRKRPEPLIYSAWLRALERRLLIDELGEAAAPLLEGNAWRVHSLLGADSLWCDNVATPAVETCDEQIAAALETALADLAEDYGDDMTGWRWGEAHFASFDHEVLRYIPVVNSLTGIDIATSGGQDTVNRAGSDYALPLDRAFVDRHGPGYRAVYDTADPEASGFIVATGNSGNILSPHYGNLVESWRDGLLLPLPEDLPEGSKTLLLMPQR
ncbi:MAG: penicillin acylase family protein [Rhodospirillales bacterium]|nr:penicillin acylase family protein [Rhodospirillales bacterium]